MEYDEKRVIGDGVRLSLWYKVRSGTHSTVSFIRMKGGIMVNKPTAEEIKRMRRKYEQWVERDRRISRLAFESRLKKVGDTRDERARTTVA